MELVESNETHDTFPFLMAEFCGTNDIMIIKFHYPVSFHVHAPVSVIRVA